MSYSLLAYLSEPYEAGGNIHPHHIYDIRQGYRHKGKSTFLPSYRLLQPNDPPLRYFVAYD